VSRPTTFCRHPSDRARCQVDLVAAHEAAQLKESCVMKGLRSEYEPCQETVADGFRQKENESLLFACERVFLQSFQEDVAAGKAVFERETRRLIEWTMTRCGVADPDERDETYQEVYLALEERFRKQKPVRGHIASYVFAVTLNKVREMRGRKEPLRMSENMQETWPSKAQPSAPVPHTVIQRWGEFDRRLAANPKNDLIDRIILAQRHVLNWAMAKRLPTKELLADWGRLGELRKEELAARLEHVVRCAEQTGEGRAPELCAFMINEDLLEVWEIPLALAVCDGLDTSDALALVSRLAKATVTFVDQRESRLKATLLRGETC